MTVESNPGLIVRKGKGDVVVRRIPEGVAQTLAVKTGDLPRGTNIPTSRFYSDLGELVVDARVTPGKIDVEVSVGSEVIARLPYDQLSINALQVVEVVEVDGVKKQELRRLSTDPERLRRGIREKLGYRATEEEVQKKFRLQYPWKFS